MSRYVGSGREKEGGFLAVHKQDFNAHVTGSDFRHSADQIDIAAIPGISATNTQQALEQLTGILTSGSGVVVTIGDGYSSGDVNVGSPGNPTLVEAFATAVSQSRLQNGGIVFIKGGTYSISGTIVVPAGISVVGDLSGTYITQNTNVPIFNVQRSFKYFARGTFPVVNANVESADMVKLYNLILVDGLIGNLCRMSSVPMIQADLCSNITVENVKFIGRTSNASPLAITQRGIAYTGPNFDGRATTLNVKNCYFDSVQSAIQFTGVQGALDTLRIDGCRARTLGLTGGSIEEQCFVSFNACNAFITNNYHVGDNTSFASSAFAVIRNQGISNTDNCTFVVTGNSGGLTTSNNNNAENFVVDNRPVKFTYSGVRTGNAWGISLNNEFYVVIGDGVSSFGDIVGSGALDFALSRFNTTLAAKTSLTILINPGAYSITGSGATVAAPKLIGLSSPTAKPVVTVTSATNVGPGSLPGFRVGAEVKGIKFVSSTFRVMNVNLNGVDAANLNISISDCAFENIGLHCDSLPIKNAGTLGYNRTLTVKNCFFYNTAQVTNNQTALYAPANFDAIEVVSNTFLGFGYAMGLGGPGFSAGRSKISISNNRFQSGLGDTTAFTINAIPFANFLPHYIWISNSQADCTIKDNAILGISETTIAGSYIPIDTALTAAGTFNKWSLFDVNSLSYESNIVKGPNQTFTSGGIVYGLPTVYCVPKAKLLVSGNDIRGQFPFQVSGSCFSSVTGGVVTRDANAVSAIIKDNLFSSYQFDIAPCLLDVDVPRHLQIAERASPTIIVSDNTFNTTTSSGTRAFPLHVNNTGATYNRLGTVQIYAGVWSVDISKNVISSSQSILDTDTTIQIAAIVCDNYINVGALSENERINTLNVNNNNVYFRLVLTGTGSGSISSYAIILNATSVFASNNVVNTDSNMTTSVFGARGWLLANSNVANNSLIQSNTFNRFTSLGDGTLTNPISLGGAFPGSYNFNVHDSPYADIVSLSGSIIIGTGWNTQDNFNIFYTDTVDLLAGQWFGVAAGNFSLNNFTNVNSIDYDAVEDGFSMSLNGGAAQVSFKTMALNFLPRNARILDFECRVKYQTAAAGLFDAFESKISQMTLTSSTIPLATSGTVSITGTSTVTATASLALSNPTTARLQLPILLELFIAVDPTVAARLSVKRMLVKYILERPISG